MRKIIYFIVFLLMIDIAIAQEINDYNSLDIQTKITSSLNLKKLTSNYQIDYVFANLTSFPRNTEFQNSENVITSEPDAKITENKNSILYYWSNPSQDQLKFSVESKINSRTNFKEITSKIKFPIEDNTFESYTIATETVTSNDTEIKKLASNLAEGEDDLYNVVWKIALWTHDNINYSLNTLTAEVSQNSRWVLDNREGVCDELTSLFIAMLRSLNIPARFVTGQSYTNVLNGFGNHAWAEVYFPGYGWVAFDPTYGQYGYVDASHIAMQEELDVKDSSINYGWRSYNVDIDASSLEANSEVISKGNLFKKDVNIKIEPLENDVGPGSYIPIKVTLTNLNDFYLPYTFYIIKAPSLVENNIKNVLLRPIETKNVFFLVNVDKNLNPGYIYTSKIEIRDIFNNVLNADLRYARTYNIYSLQEAQEKINALTEEEVKNYSKEVSLECKKDKDFYYNYEKINLSCKLSNIGNTNLENLNICLKDYCQNADLRITDKREFNFSLDASENLPELIIKAENDDVSKSDFIKLNILKLPNIKILDLKYQNNVNYNDKYELELTLMSDSEANDIVIKLANKELLKLDKFNDKQTFKLNFKGNDIYKKDTKLQIDYKDKNNVNYNVDEDLQIEVTNIPIYIKFWFWIIISLLIIIISMILQNKLRR